MTSTKRFATTWAESREDLGENPVLAGPIFEEVIEVTAQKGTDPPVSNERSAIAG